MIPGICRSVVLLWNRLLCRGFRIVTYPWKRTADRMVFLYYLLPGWFRKILVLSGGQMQTALQDQETAQIMSGQVKTWDVIEGLTGIGTCPAPSAWHGQPLCGDQ